MKRVLIWVTIGYILEILLIFHGSMWEVGVLVYYVWLLEQKADKKFLKKVLIYDALLLAFLMGYYWRLGSHFQEGRGTFILEVPIHEVKVKGDLLQFMGREVKSGEWLVSFYRLPQLEVKESWLNRGQSLLIKVTGELKVPNAANNLGGFNYRQFLEREEIYWTLSVDRLQILGNMRGPLAVLSNVRKAIYCSLEGMGEPIIGNYVKALFFNERSGIDKEVMQSYQAIGIIHLFSLSGFHVNYLLKLLKKTLLRIGVLREYYDWVALGVLGIYGTILGWPYGMFRAVGVYVLVFIQRRRKKRPHLLESICGVMLAHLLFKPQALFSLGFQLTYALSLGLFFVSQARDQWKNWQLTLGNALTCTLITLPFLIQTYASFNLLMVFANYFYAWLFTVILFPCLLLLAFGYWLGLGWMLSPLRGLVALGIQTTEAISQEMITWEIFHVIIGYLPGILVLVLVLGIGQWIDSFILRKNCRRTSLLLLGLLGALYAWPSLRPIGQVAMLNVGQGDCLMFQAPYSSRAYLIDACGLPSFPKEAWQERPIESLASREITPTLRRQGIRSLAGIFLTHGDIDHYGSIPELLKVWSVDNLYLPIGMKENTKVLSILKEGLKASKNPKIQVHWLGKGQQLILDKGQKVEVLMPDHIGQGKNEDSLALYAHLGQKSYLFTGDIGGEAERKMVDNLCRKKVDVLKVAHHGSDYSSPKDLLERIHPKVAWISVGKKNTYGHPSKRVIKNLKDLKVMVYRADQDGGTHYFYSFLGGYFQCARENDQ